MPYWVGVKNGFVVTWLTKTNLYFGVAGKLPAPPLEAAAPLLLLLSSSLDLPQAASAAASATPPPAIALRRKSARRSMPDARPRRLDLLRGPTRAPPPLAVKTGRRQRGRARAGSLSPPSAHRRSGPSRQAGRRDVSAHISPVSRQRTVTGVSAVSANRRRRPVLARTTSSGATVVARRARVPASICSSSTWRLQPAHLVEVLPHGRQRRGEVRRLGDVVEADDADLVGYAAARLVAASAGRRAPSGRWPRTPRSPPAFAASRWPSS